MDNKHPGVTPAQLWRICWFCPHYGNRWRLDFRVLLKMRSPTFVTLTLGTTLLQAIFSLCLTFTPTCVLQRQHRISLIIFTSVYCLNVFFYSITGIIFLNMTFQFGVSANIVNKKHAVACRYGIPVIKNNGLSKVEFHNHNNNLWDCRDIVSSLSLLQVL